MTLKLFGTKNISSEFQGVLDIYQEAKMWESVLDIFWEFILKFGQIGEKAAENTRPNHQNIPVEICQRFHQHNINNILLKFS